MMNSMHRVPLQIKPSFWDGLSFNPIPKVLSLNKFNFFPQKTRLKLIHKFFIPDGIFTECLRASYLFFNQVLVKTMLA